MCSLGSAVWAAEGPSPTGPMDRPQGMYLVLYGLQNRFVSSSIFHFVHLYMRPAQGLALGEYGGYSLACASPGDSLISYEF